MGTKRGKRRRGKNGEISEERTAAVAAAGASLARSARKEGRGTARSGWGTPCAGRAYAPTACASAASTRTGTPTPRRSRPRRLRTTAGGSDGRPGAEEWEARSASAWSDSPRVARWQRQRRARGASTAKAALRSALAFRLTSTPDAPSAGTARLRKHERRGPDGPRCPPRTRLAAPRRTRQRHSPLDFTGIQSAGPPTQRYPGQRAQQIMNIIVRLEPPPADSTVPKVADPLGLRPPR